MRRIFRLSQLAYIKIALGSIIGISGLLFASEGYLINSDMKNDRPAGI